MAMQLNHCIALVGLDCFLIYHHSLCDIYRSVKVSILFQPSDISAFYSLLTYGGLEDVSEG